MTNANFWHYFGSVIKMFLPSTSCRRCFCEPHKQAKTPQVNHTQHEIKSSFCGWQNYRTFVFGFLSVVPKSRGLIHRHYRQTAVLGRSDATLTFSIIGFALGMTVKVTESFCVIIAVSKNIFFLFISQFAASNLTSKC